MSQTKTVDFDAAEDFLLSRLEGLPASLTYHSIGHTLDVLNASMNIAGTEKISEEEKKLLRISVLLHDSGFVYVYKAHEEKGCELARESLPGLGFTNDQVETICGMIMATKTPQTPKTILEQIIADADLDYLGRDDVYIIAARLFEELKTYGFITLEEDWNRLQINFLREHHYFTNYSKANRQPRKQQYFNELLKKV